MQELGLRVLFNVYKAWPSTGLLTHRMGSTGTALSHSAAERGPSRAQVSAPAATGDVKPVSSSGKCRFHFFVNEKTEGDF